MSKHDEPYKRYNIYIPVRVYQIIAKEAVRKNRPVSQEIEDALGWYSELLKEFYEAMQANLGDERKEEE